AKLMVRSLFLAGHAAVALDATNLTVRAREQWASPDWSRELIWVQTPAHVCRSRAEAAGDPEILPVIDRMAGQVELPCEEVFSRVCRYDQHGNYMGEGIG